MGSGQSVRVSHSYDDDDDDDDDDEATRDPPIDRDRLREFL